MNVCKIHNGTTFTVSSLFFVFFLNIVLSLTYITVNLLGRFYVEMSVSEIRPGGVRDNDSDAA